ncbi:hypothetical protein CAPTEDRAFT_186691 [Capitella teleta]|uniref:Nuclear receptor subfamily 5 group A member 2 n=1 Tax=Capitella teleta TaxID=283909 RepID=R7TQ02_CAPTE|nr:hypothetical protein CAPTEDRAFT_186691 [Capitella teleta]|eukprot:ELT95968.1 hypothetical protein CAPTEDRAFT_186691 [Capitella teleta]
MTPPDSNPQGPPYRDQDTASSSSMNDYQYGPDIKVGIEELCPVCGDKVSGYHYGLQTCESCKGFFKRTVQNKKVYSCVDNRNCMIDKTQRKRCPYCRFQKCLSVGMKLEAVRSDRMRGGRNKFGPMYKRDRALKQQAIRQRQQMLAQMHHQGQFLPHHSSHAGSHQQMPPQQYPLMPPCSSPLSSMSAMTPDMHSPPPSLHHVRPPHGPPEPPPLLSPSPRGDSSPGGGGLPQLIRDLQRNEPSQEEMQHKLSAIADMMMAQDPSLAALASTAASSGDMDSGRPFLRSALQLVCKLCDQALFLLVEWARGAAFFKQHKVEDQMKLLQNCWSELLILDFVFKQMSHNKLDQLRMITGHLVDIQILERMGLEDIKERLVDIIVKFRELKLDANEFTCLKFLILLNPDVSGLTYRQQLEQNQEKVNAAMLEYCSTFYPGIRDKFGQLLVRLPEIRLMSLRIEDYLYYQHMNGNIPENTLLMEMLHSKRK